MRPRLADYVLSMPRGAQIMYPKDIAQVIQLGDIRSGMRVLESGAGSGAMSVNLLDAVGERGHLTTIELRPEFAKVAQANATLYYGEAPSWWDLKTGDFDSVAAELPEHWFDRIMLDMLDPWNRLEQAYRGSSSSICASRCSSVSESMSVCVSLVTRSRFLSASNPEAMAREITRKPV